jgi:hypothetical protein
MSKAPPRTGAAKKPKLARASTSVARLQTSNDGQKNTLRPNAATKETLEIDITQDKTKFSLLVSPSGNDSDKENWSPDEEGNPHYRFNSPHNPSSVPSPVKRRPLPSSSLQKQSQNSRRTTHGNRILQEQRPSLFGNRANTAPATNRHRAGKGAQTQLEIFEDTSPRSAGKENRGAVVDDEVERFMRGEVSPSKKGDVDAVAGLLSLSQGNWR